ncbi:MAG TPA: helix-turn-helix domain-containing protein [Nitrosopumilaceae archaeon]|nr:helix-turn-helix domain-containing protein [Nitrosopumilaceae archaeon]
MSTLVERQIQVNRILTMNQNQARAIEDPARARMIKILYKKELTVEQIAKELRKTGYKKALTTIRHHIEILKDTGLIEIVKIEETRGAITKFYSTSTKLLGFDIPDDFETKYSTIIKNTSTKMEKILKSIDPKVMIKSKNKKTSDPEGYSQYLLMEIVNRAMTNVLENGKNKHSK